MSTPEPQKAADEHELKAHGSEACVCGRRKEQHAVRPAAPGAPWHPYTVPTGRHERGCLVISGPHDASLCGSLWDREESQR